MVGVVSRDESRPLRGEAATLREALTREREQADREAARADQAENAAAAARQGQATERDRAEGALIREAETRAELDRRRIEAETIQGLGFLGRLAWAFRGGRP
jgi:hypothetical protein